MVCSSVKGKWSKKTKHPNEQTFKNRKTVANKAGDSSDPSSIIHQLLVSCLGMWQRPHSQISVVRFCPTKSVLGETNIGTDTHSATKIALTAHAHTLLRSRLQLRLTCEWLEYLHCGGPQVVGQRECTSNTSPGDAHHICLSLPLMPTRPPSLILTPFCRLRSVTLSDCATHWGLH